jgi:hypothetical protein
MFLRDTRPPGAPVLTPEGGRLRAPDSGEVRIRCPLCQWRHDFQPHWMCERCSTTFDTFRTRAHCPSCDNSWLETWCPACARPSLHDDWYVSEPRSEA